MRSADIRCSVGRPTKLEKRIRQLNLKLTEREFTWIKARASKADMRPVEFGRAQLLAERPLRARPAAPTYLDPLFIAHISRIGSNLNQIARRFNEFHVPAASTLKPLLDAIQDILRRASAHGS